MPWDATALVLVAAVLHAGWNLVAKTANAHHFSLISAALLAVVWAPVGGWALWTADATPLGWALIGASALAHLGYFQVLLRGYREADLTVVYPVARGTGPLLSSLGAFALLAERPSPLGVFGLLAIPLGVFVLAGGPGALRGGERASKGVFYGAFTGIWIAAYTVIDAYAVKTLLLSPILVDYVGQALRVPILLPGALRDRERFWAEVRGTWRQALVVGTVSPVAYWLVLYAVQRAPLSRVAPLREVSMLVAALLGGTLLGEGQRGSRLLGAALIATGAVALTR